MTTKPLLELSISVCDDCTVRADICFLDQAAENPATDAGQEEVHAALFEEQAGAAASGAAEYMPSAPLGMLLSSARETIVPVLHDAVRRTLMIGLD